MGHKLSLQFFTDFTFLHQVLDFTSYIYTYFSILLSICVICCWDLGSIHKILSKELYLSTVGWTSFFILLWGIEYNFCLFCQICSHSCANIMCLPLVHHPTENIAICLFLGVQSCKDIWHDIYKSAISLIRICKHWLRKKGMHLTC